MPLTVFGLFRILLAGIAFVALPLPANAQNAEKEAEEVLSAVVRVKSKILPSARSIATLGAARDGSGVLIRDSLVLTIGYLVIEAESIEVADAAGKTVPATLAGYDHASGFGLLRLVLPLGGKPLPLGDSAALGERDPVMIASHGGREGASLAYVVSRRAFTGSWEYMLDSAIFTYPPAMNWSGAALIGPKGELLGVGSLIVPDAAQPGTQSPGNMFVPIDLLKPILGDLLEHGRASGPVRPWLGMTTEELRGRLFVARVSPEGPAERAGVHNGDIIIGVGGEEVASLADFYRKLWSRGAAGSEVPLRLLQGTQVKEISVRSIDRLEYFKARPSY
ncbi:MAG: serine protease [Betaproteobacteria bacterium]|nr:serine protease [Betaproteobacteria bacterium]